MFDPTAFENMRVVVEGALYDLDLNDQIRILDRNDLMNTAKLSRKYEVMFTDKLDGKAELTCTFIMEAGLANLAAELLPTAHSEHLAGCNLFVKFTLKHQNDLSLFQKVAQVLKAIWGLERTIQQTIISDPFGDQKMITNETMVIFNRLVYEDQIDDIIAMVDYMAVSLEKLRMVI